MLLQLLHTHDDTTIRRTQQQMYTTTPPTLLVLCFLLLQSCACLRVPEQQHKRLDSIRFESTHPVALPLRPSGTPDCHGHDARSQTLSPSRCLWYTVSNRLPSVPCVTGATGLPTAARPPLSLLPPYTLSLLTTPSIATCVLRAASGRYSLQAHMAHPPSPASPYPPDQ